MISRTSRLGGDKILYSHAIRKFLSLKSEWKLMVIGDRKTPKDWLEHIAEPDRHNVIFLTIDEQKKFSYRIINYLPEGSYARKNIGYLTSIECGAKIIYESDDDNLLITDDIKVLPKRSTLMHIPSFAFHRKRSSFVNIYGTFGHPKIWPRGFPLDELKTVTEDGWSSTRGTRPDDKINAYIQQYLADLDPDVDAIYRLANPMTLGHIRFIREQKPVALEPFTFSPYNTQNTITHYEAFWGLYLPVTTTFRVCDIWRGFWVQRILWDIGGHLVFGSSTVDQKRNAHSYIKDMDDEQQLYHQSGQFVRFLIEWTSPAESLFQRISQLASDIATNSFWNQKEVDILNAWLDDLIQIGYQPPSPTIIDKKNATQIRRAALCVTGPTKYINDNWRNTEADIKRRVNGVTDVFLFLSSTNETAQLDKLLTYNATVKVLYEDRQLDYLSR
ncbi:unnamed protein product, partial [Didymodactylos carnosus]